MLVAVLDPDDRHPHPPRPLDEAADVAITASRS
jgi:hypothetical protein